MTNPLARLWRGFRFRPRLLSSIALGVAVWWWLPMSWAQHGPTRALLAWNTGALAYLALAWTMMATSSEERIARRALQEDDGRYVVLALAVLAGLAVLVAVASQMAMVKDLAAAPRRAHIVLAIGTIVVAWLFVQTSFALHYAHEFFLARRLGRPDGLQFPGTSQPGYPDFMYFACIIGTSGQTADVSFVGSAMRSLGMLHCVLAFFFNVAVIGLAINIGASLLAP